MKKLLLILSLLCCYSSLMSTESSMPNKAKRLALADGLVAYYPFNGNANDESGNGNHGTPTSTVTLTTGIGGDSNGAYQFGGYDNPGHIHIPNSESLKFNTVASISVYVKPTSWISMNGWGTRVGSGGAQCMIAKSHDRRGLVFHLFGWEDRIQTSSNYNDGILNSGDLYGNYLNIWTHLAFVFNEEKACIYVDGKLVKEEGSTPDFSTMNNQDLYIGKFSDSWYPFNGVIDEVRIYNRALTDNEIKQLAQDVNHSSFFVCPDDNHPHLIDLGLPSGTKWACCNVGANSPEEYGGYYAWGEIETKDEYTWSTYKWCNGSQFSMNKYCNNPDYGNIDNITILEPEDDAAYMNWGPAWRMPTREQQDEIRNNCAWIWATYKNVSGMLIKSRINDSFVFLPAAGYISGVSPSNTADYGYYQSASLDLDVSDDSYYFYFNSRGHYWNDFSTTVGRDVGFSVRPISINTSNIPISSITLQSPPNSIKVGESITLYPSISPSNATNSALEWKSSNESVARVSNGVVTGVGEGSAQITASATDGSGKSGSCWISVKKPDETPQEVPIYACRGFVNYYKKIEVKGLTADGKSQVFIPWQRDKQPTGSPRINITDSKGQPIDAGPSETGTISSLQTKFDEKGFVYEAPIDFKSDYTEEYYLAQISVPVENGINEPYYESLASVRIYRAGLLLVHGLWGDATSFEKFGKYLDNNSEYKPLYHLVDYEKSHAASFEDNTFDYEVMENACINIYNDYMKKNVVSRCYDFVGHSMGGILSRLYVQDVDNDAAHKIITVNTPHWGSGFADRGEELRRIIGMTPGSFLLTAGVEYVYFKNPAIYDLKSSSNAIKHLGQGAHVIGEKSIPVHAVCSVLDDTGIANDERMKYFKETDYSAYLNASFHLFIENMTPDGESILKWVFNEDEHDGVVELTSQKSGLPDDHCTVENQIYKGYFGIDSDSHHMNTTKWSETHNNLVSLLKAKTTDKRFDKNGFKDISVKQGTPGMTQTRELPVPKAPASGNTFIALGHDLIIENDSVKVDIELTHSDDIVKNMIYGFLNEDKVITGIGRDDYTLLFPNTYSGSFMLYALGMTGNNEIVSDSILLEIPTVATIDYINFIGEPSSMSVGQKSVFSVKAIWSNGEETYIQPEFTTSDESILKVNDYYIEAVGEGTSMLIASYEGHSVSAMIDVVDYGEIDGLTEIHTEGKCRIYNDGETLYVEAPDARIRNMELRIFDSSGTLIQNLHVTTNSSKKAFSMDLGNRKGLFVVQCISDDFKGSYRFVY